MSKQRLFSLLALLWVLLALPSDGYLGPARTELMLDQAVSGHRFQIVAWERGALAEKAHDWVTPPRLRSHAPRTTRSGRDLL